MNKDYEFFLKQEDHEVPADLKMKISREIAILMNPNPVKIFLKVLSVHSIVGSMSLAVCHQFGMNPFNTSKSLSDWIMNLWGHGACMVFCGLIFISISVFMSGYFLTIEEVRVLRKNEVLQMLAVGSFSLLVFLIFGAELGSLFTLFWMFGLLIGGVSMTEFVWFLRTRLNGN